MDAKKRFFELLAKKSHTQQNERKCRKMFKRFFYCFKVFTKCSSQSFFITFLCDIFLPRNRVRFLLIVTQFSCDINWIFREKWWSINSLLTFSSRSNLQIFRKEHLRSWILTFLNDFRLKVDEFPFLWILGLCQDAKEFQF